MKQSSQRPGGQTAGAAHPPVDQRMLGAIRQLEGRWKLSILATLFAARRTLRFSELIRSLPGISPKVLTLQLRDLADKGLVNRHVIDCVPLHVDYELSRGGNALGPALSALLAWVNSGSGPLS